MSTTTRETHKVDVPEGRSGDVEVRRLEIEDSIWARIHYGSRTTSPGTYTALYRRGVLWMSDTDAEWRDHSEVAWQIKRRGGRVLVNGLGLGMIVRAALAVPEVEHVDVVEIDPDVIALVGPTYEGPRCTIHEADAYTIQWPTGTRWTVAWHDIWPDLCVDNLETMATLHRRYGRRVDWQGSWARELLQSQRRRERASGWSW